MGKGTDGERDPSPLPSVTPSGIALQKMSSDVQAFSLTPPSGGQNQGHRNDAGAPSGGRDFSADGGLPDYLFRRERENEAHADGGEAPFLSEAKVGFVGRRVAETCLGGWRFAAGDQGCTEMGYVHVIQLLLLALPYGVAVAVEAATGGSNGLVAPLVYAGAMVALAALTRGASAWADSRADGMSVVMGGKFGADEDEVDFEGCANASTYSYICSPAVGWARGLAHLVALGGVCFVAEACLSWDALTAISGVSETVRLVGHVGGWMATCLSVYALSVHEPEDPNLHAASCSALSRGFHVCAALFPLLLVREGAVTMLPVYTSVLLVLVATMPFWWLLGSLPPLDAAVGWAAEQAAIHLHGCSAAASPMRLLVSLIGAWLTVAITTGVAGSSTVSALAASSLLGVLLSQDLLPVARVVGGGEGGAVAVTSAGAVRVCARFALGALPVGALLILNDDTQPMLSADMLQTGAQALLGVRVFAAFLSQLRRPFMMTVVGNCTYGKTPPCCGSIYPVVMGLLRMALSAYLLFALRYERHALGSLSATPSLMWCIAVSRALRLAWQSPGDSVAEVFVAALLISADAVPTGVSYPVLLLLCGLGWSRLLEFKDKVAFLTTVIATSWVSKGQRNSFKGWVHVLLTLAYPLWLVVAAAAAALSAPLLPLVGSPCFVIGFPRPRWHGAPTTQAWKSRTGQRSVGEVTEPEGTADQALYKHMLPSLCEQFGKAYSGGAPGELRGGDHFVVRYEDCVAWITVLECGYGYNVLAVQGLELKITSCHNVEGLRMDEVLAPSALSKGAARDSIGCTSWPGHLLRPICAMTVHAYSNSPTVLTGIIDSKENIERFPAAFLKALIWSFAQQGARVDGESPVLLYGIGQREKAAAEALFPRDFATYLESNDMCPPIVGGDGQRFAGQKLEDLVCAAFALAEANRAQRPKDIYGMFCAPDSGKRVAGVDDGGIPLAFREVVVRSYQMGFKLVYDAAIYILMDLEDASEVSGVLKEMTNEWHIGAIEEPVWNRMMLAGTPKLFTVGTDGGSTVDQGEGSGGGASDTFTARILQARGVEMLLGGLNPEAVRGLWASMGHELLYLTNDDDERFSIQANPPLMRNLTLQAAPTPLGYAAFEACHVSVDPMGAVGQASNVTPVVTIAPAPAAPAAATAGPAAGGNSDLPYGGDMQAAMRAQDRDAIKKIMASRSENPPPLAAAPSLADMGARFGLLEVPAPAPSPTRSPTIHRPSDGGYGGPGGYGGGMAHDDLDELDTILSDVEALAPAPSWNSRSPAAAAPAPSWRDAPAPAPGTSWMDAVMSEVENDEASNPFSVPTTTQANSTRGAAPAAGSIGGPFGPGGDDDDILKQLEASEARLNAARDSAAPVAAPAPAGFGSPQRDGDGDLDELDDLLEEFM